jgi:DNA polymerase-1
MLFDEEDFSKLRKNTALRVPPPPPDNGWRPPTSFPNLSSAVSLSIDTETKEPDFDHGPGWGRGKGHMVGFSVGAIDAHGNRGAWYFPLRHEFQPEYNLDPNTCLAWLKTVMETPHIPKVGANLIYDMGWLMTANIRLQGELHDVQFAEALLKEDGKVGLEYLGQKYCGMGKESDEMYQWLADAYGGDANGKQRANIYRASPLTVGMYGESDADLPLRVLEKQFPALHQMGLYDVYRMECDMIPLMVDMRYTGVRIDMPKAEKLYHDLGPIIDTKNQQLKDLTGVWANVNSSHDLAKVFDAVGIGYNRTKAGNPSFRKEFLQSVEHPVAEMIRDIREHIKIRETFIKSYLLEKSIYGRVHGQFHPLRGDAGGTRSGRFASSHPNLQNIPVRTELGKRIRTLFVPDDGHLCWEQDDYSQIEYRMLAHFATGPGSDELRAEYNANPRTDYHDNTYYRLCPFMGWAEDDDATRKKFRKPVKNINFGLLYGMGKAKLGRSIMEYFKGNLSQKDIDALFDAYHNANPYVKDTMDSVAGFAQNNGYIETILNRRSWFEKWEPADVDYQNRAMPVRYEDAIGRWGYKIQRAHTHKAINRKLQGSAADAIKKGMHACYKAGVFDVIGVPKLQVHDELDFSVPDDSPQMREGFAEMRRLLAESLDVSVPILVDSERGPNWGDVE